MTAIAGTVIFALAAFVIAYLVFVTKLSFSFQSPATDEQTPTDVDERTLRLADEVDRLNDEADALAAELVKERALVATSAGALRGFIGTHGDACSWGRDCVSLADAKAVLAEMDIQPAARPRVRPQPVRKSGDSS